MIPTHVFVEFSESAIFENKKYLFAEFEEKARYISCYEITGGYYKTWITVMFYSGKTYRCRLDLNTEKRSFQDHIIKCLNGYYRKMEEQQKSGSIAKAMLESYKKLVPFWKSIEFSTAKDKKVEAKERYRSLNTQVFSLHYYC